MKKAAVLGFPIKHSLSPKLHGYWLNQYGIEGSYKAIEAAPDSLMETFARLKKEGYAGWNVTVPHKEHALLMVDEVDEIARAIGAVNTVVVKGGKLVGYNTDAFGFLQNLVTSRTDNLPVPQQFESKKGMVIGAGGASRAVIAALKSAGLSEILITNRTQEKAEKLIDAFVVDKAGFTVIPWDEKDQALENIDYLINTTSLGMEGQPPLEINLSALPKTAVVNDIVYKPLETELLKQAKTHGVQAVDGIGMLIWQAVPGFNAWFGKEPEVTSELKDYMVTLSKG